MSPVRWFEGGTRLIVECGDPGQLPAVVLSRLEENSAKGDDSISLFAQEGEAERAGQGVYAPTGVSNPKIAMLARYIAWVWTLYPLISDKKRSIAIGAYARSTGCAWYARSWQHGTFQDLLLKPADEFERRIQLLSLAMPRWQVGNPFVFNPKLIDRNTEAALLVERRFKGTDGLPSLIDRALQAGVASAPT